MLFNSLPFLIFFPCVFVLYYALPFRLRKYMLLIASYYFYMCWKPEFIVLILLSTLVDYFCGLGMVRYPERKKWLLAVSLAMNLGLLFFFKYLNFFGETLTALCRAVSIPFSAPALNIILPVGISFYTFQTLSYTLDVYRGKLEPERDFVTFALFVSFFPQLVAGPIEKATDLLPQLKEEHPFTYENAAWGAKLMVWGFFKKMVVADQLAVLIVDPVYQNLGKYEGGALVLATCAFAFQVYCDFGGYSDIARGAARMMGVDLMVNFKSPYFFSHSIGNYWQRNHISLSRWFTEYVYIPLGGSRKGRVKQYWFTTVTFFLSGLWHGAEWSFVVWGLLQAVYLNLERAFHRGKEPPKSPPLHLLAIVTTFALSCFSLIFFRAANIEEALYVVRHLLWGIGSPVLYVKTALSTLNPGMIETAVLAGALLLLFLFDLADERTDAIAMVSRWPVAIRWACYLGLVMIVLVFGVYGPGYDVKAFTYFQF
jgi:alginate O-acetyltransferase complex protein AlgI